MIANEIVLAVSALADALVFFLIFDAFFERKSYLPKALYGCGFLALALCIALSNALLQFSFANALVMILAASVCAGALYDERWYKKLLISFLSCTFMGAVEVVVLFLIAVSFSLSVSDIIHIQAYQMLGIIVSKWMSVAICIAIRSKISRHKQSIGKTYWLLFLVLVTSTIVAVFLLFKLNYEIETTAYNSAAVIASLGLLLGTLFALYLYARQITQNARILEQEQYEQHMKAQLKHLEDNLAKQEELRKFKHDLSNKLGGLRGCLQAHDIDGSLEYVNSMTNTLYDLTPAFNTGNIALDATLSTKKALAESKGILFETEIRLAGKLPLQPEDTCVIFGNALDNAIEGCARVHDRPQRIALTLVQVKDHILCEITNTAILQAISTETTSKQDTLNHGFGLTNLKESLAKYGSSPEIVWENGAFSLSFTLYIDHE